MGRVGDVVGEEQAQQFRNIDDTLVHKVVPWNKCLCLRKKNK
jgi:hypothetical protein